MKRKIISIASKNGFEVHDYKSYRSDMGCQCFDMYVVYFGKRYNFDYGYYFGGEQNKLLEKFNDFLNNIIKNTQ